MKATWTPEQDAWLASLAEQGLTALQAAPILGFSRNAVLGRAHRTGVKFKNRKVRQPKTPRAARAPRPLIERRPARQRISPAVKEKARELYLSGETYVKISAATGVPIGSFGTLFSDLPRRRSVTWDTKPKGREFRLEALTLALVTSYAKAAHALHCAEGSIQNWRDDETLYAEAKAIAARLTEERLRAAAEAKVRADLARLDQLAAISKHNASVFPLLTERQRVVIQRRIAGDTLQEIGDDLGVTRERIRQIEGRCRSLGILLPDAKPLSEAALATFALKPARERKVRPVRQARRPGERRPYNLSEAERQRRSERMREFWASR